MDRTRSNDNEETSVFVNAMDDIDGFVAAVEDGLGRQGRLADLVLEEFGGCEGGHASDAEVLDACAVADICVGEEELGRVVLVSTAIGSDGGHV